MKMQGNDHHRSNEGIFVGQAQKYCYCGVWGQFWCYCYSWGWSWFNYEYASQSGVINRTEIWVIDP